jgi:hypothetical protein
MISAISLGQHKQYVTTISLKPYSQNYTLQEHILDHVAIGRLHKKKNHNYIHQMIVLLHSL